MESYLAAIADQLFRTAGESARDVLVGSREHGNLGRRPFCGAERPAVLGQGSFDGSAHRLIVEGIVSAEQKPPRFPSAGQRISQITLDCAYALLRSLASVFHLLLRMVRAVVGLVPIKFSVKAA